MRSISLVSLALAVSCSACVKNQPKQTVGGDDPGGEDVGDPSVPDHGMEDPPWEPRECDGASVLCVDRAAAGGGDGSAARPFNDVKAAIAAASDGAVVQVAAGTYEQSLTIEGKRIGLYGGFAAGGDFRSRDRRAHVTTLAGTGSAVVSVLADGVVIDGFRITGGTGRCDEYRCQGGGVFVQADDVEIARNEISGNKVEHKEYNAALGGGIYAAGKVRIIGNVVRDNRAERGAGIFGEGVLVVSDNRVEANKAHGDHGGGMSLSGASVTVVRNVVVGNEVRHPEGYAWGGGILIHSQPTKFEMRGNLVADNLAASSGSGVFIDDGAVGKMIGDIIVRNRCGALGGTGLMADRMDDSGNNGSVVEVVNATIADNNCPNVQLGGNAVWSEGKGTRVTLRNCILWNNASDFFKDGAGYIAATYTLTGSAFSGTGNLTGDPRFVDPQKLDYHLRSTAGHYDPGKKQWVTDSVSSPAIDKGAPDDPHDQEPAPNGGRIDLGAYGNTTEASRSP